MFNLVLLNDKDYLATRVSHQFNLRGPSLSVQTACSSSLVAVHLACQSLLSGECDMVLAGAASIRVPHHVGYTYEPGAMVSASGHCRPFDVRSDGTIFGSGVAAVILKPLQAALDDGDRIHAVIRGSAINNDGSVKMTYAAPALAGQAEVIAEAHAVAGVDASTIGFVETHGTGTPLGDPIEVEALRQAFEVSEPTGPARGAGFGEVEHRPSGCGVRRRRPHQDDLVPEESGDSPDPALHRTEPRTTSGTRLRRSEPLRTLGIRCAPAGWSELVRCRWHQCSRRPRGGAADLLRRHGPERSAGAAVVRPHRRVPAGRQGRACGGTLARRNLSLPDVAFTLAGRRSYELRMAAVVADRADAAAVLTAEEHEKVSVGQCPPGLSPGGKRLAFLFPGQGAQHVGMARGLYDTEPVFRETFDRCAAGFAEELGIDLSAEVFDGTGLEPTDLAQPALFAVEYALAQLICPAGSHRRRWPDTASANLWPPPWRGFSTCRRR